MPDAKIEKTYVERLPLKYGCNPHQAQAALLTEDGGALPFRVLNGTPGYINVLDALNGWQLVRELRQALNLPAAASFKHVSPAGAALGLDLLPMAREVHAADEKAFSPLALAYLRARGADPKSSFGDFAALSDPVDETTAQVFKSEVSDGVIAPGYDKQALDILKRKKNGNFIVLEADPEYEPPPMEYKEIFGVVFSQQRNEVQFGPQHLENRVTKRKQLDDGAVRDLILASIAIKYTQSNSVGYALDGQMIGVGAGQQSRVDCTKLAGRKADTWYLRQHPRVRELPFKAGVRRVDRVNAQVRYIEGDFTPNELQAWQALFDPVPELLDGEAKSKWLDDLDGVSLASDAFFPFRDSIDHAAQHGVKYVVQPGGSVADPSVIEACDEYGMVMAFSGLRLFHH
ncbi:MAG: phosphoribosylaminoimidazolecarboxamide formyltransferase [SAR324 cluster bacterium]|nr:phosphoribosylaminoimidazolecarboxamide formyltransferase [SAR324 cluster bacterium]